MTQEVLQVKYQSYLLRMWWDSPSAGWRVSLEDPVTGQKQGFADLDCVFEFLREQARLGEYSGAVLEDF